MKMTHPDIEAAGDVLDRDQFNKIYAPRGWSLMNEATQFANEHMGRFIRDSSAGEGKGGLTKDEARGLIAARGGEYPEADASEADVLAAYHETFGDRPAKPVPSMDTATGVRIVRYDPKDHPVHPNADGTDQGVLAYLENADDDERQRVLELEEAGQARTTVLNWSPPDTDSADADDQNKEA